MSTFVRLAERGEPTKYVPTSQVVFAERRSSDGIVNVGYLVGPGQVEEFLASRASATKVWSELRDSGAFAEFSGVSGGLADKEDLLVNPIHIFNVSAEESRRGLIAVTGRAYFGVNRLSSAIATLEAHMGADKPPKTLE